MLEFFRHFLDNVEKNSPCLAAGGENELTTVPERRNDRDSVLNQYRFVFSESPQSPMIDGYCSTNNNRCA